MIEMGHLVIAEDALLPLVQSHCLKREGCKQGCSTSISEGGDFCNKSSLQHIPSYFVLVPEYQSLE